MINRILLNTDDVLVTLSFFGKLKVTLAKPYPRSFKATPEEKAYFFAAADEFEKRGKLSPDNASFCEFVEEFALHLSARGEPTWIAFFTGVDPKAWASNDTEDD